MIGSLKNPSNELVFLKFIKKEFKAGSLRYTKLLGKDAVIEVNRDNHACIRVCQTGRNPTMRDFSRTHGLSIAQLHQALSDPQVCLNFFLSG